MRGAENREPVFRLVVVDGMSAHDERAGLAHLVGSAPHDLGDHLGAERHGKRQYVQGDERLRAHREHVGKRVAGGNGAELVRVVDNRREEVERQHGRQVVAQAVHGAIVARLEPEHDVAVHLRRSDLLQDFLELTRSPLGRSTAVTGVLREPDFYVVLALRHVTTFAHRCRQRLYHRRRTPSPHSTSKRPSWSPTSFPPLTQRGVSPLG